MFRHHKLVCGGLFVVFSVTNLGCAGNGVKNLFSRNETDGYHTLEELESQDRLLAEAKDSSGDEKTPSMTTRLASWRPFAKPESQDEEAYAVSDVGGSPGDEESKSSARFFGLPFSGREAVEPDPFLGADPLLADRGKSPAAKKDAEPKMATVDGQPAKHNDAFAFETGQKPSAKKATEFDIRRLMHDEKKEDPKDATAVALGAKPKSQSVAAEEEDLAKRFEQHFLLSSSETMTKESSDVKASGKDLRKKVEANAPKTAAKQRDVANIADRQIDRIDQLLAADSTPRTTRTSTRKTLPKVTQDHSLASFDRLLGTEREPAEPAFENRIRTVARTIEAKQPARDVKVAVAETLFGAAAARQQARDEQRQGPAESDIQPTHISRTSGWAQGSEDAEKFGWNEAAQAALESNPELTHGDPFAAFGGGDQTRARTDRVLREGFSFGAPQVTAGNVDEHDESFMNRLASSATPGIVIASNRGPRSASAIRPIPMDLSVADGAYLTSAPMAPIASAASGDETTAAGTRTGLIQSLSARNWLLLIGGMIVIALLFAPGRTKPLAMNG